MWDFSNCCLSCWREFRQNLFSELGLGPGQVSSGLWNAPKHASGLLHCVFDVLSSEDCKSKAWWSLKSSEELVCLGVSKFQLRFSSLCKNKHVHVPCYYADLLSLQIHGKNNMFTKRSVVKYISKFPYVMLSVDVWFVDLLYIDPGPCESFRVKGGGWQTVWETPSFQCLLLIWVQWQF